MLFWSVISVFSFNEFCFVCLNADGLPRWKTFLQEMGEKYPIISSKNRATILEELKIAFTQDVPLLYEISEQIVKENIGFGLAKDLDGLVMRAAMATFGQAIPSQLNHSLLGLKRFIRDSLKECIGWRGITTADLEEIQKTSLTEDEVERSIRFVNSRFFNYFAKGPITTQTSPEDPIEKKQFDRYSKVVAIANTAGITAQTISFAIKIPSILLSLGLASAAIALPAAVVVPLSVVFAAISVTSVIAYFSIIYNQNKSTKLLNVLNEWQAAKNFYLKADKATLTPLERFCLERGLNISRFVKNHKNRSIEIYDAVPKVTRSLLNRIYSWKDKSTELSKFYSMIRDMKNPSNELTDETKTRSKAQFLKLIYSITSSKKHYNYNDYPIFLALMQALDIAQVNEGKPSFAGFIFNKDKFRRSIDEQSRRLEQGSQMSTPLK